MMVICAPGYKAEMHPVCLTSHYKPGKILYSPNECTKKISQLNGAVALAMIDEPIKYSLLYIVFYLAHLSQFVTR
jgi:hypothetical protein